jgi:hypothetical protein
MTDTCGCCEGLDVLTPLALANRPGLSELKYRIGTHGSFLESMKARLSSSCYLALRGLTTRDSSDAAIALLDAWATVADVLTFYQERIAHEGYLRTATERRSVLELARLIGYRLRPGVAANAYLAFTIDKSFNVEIPAGTRAQSLPGPGEVPQPFETVEPLAARSEWNALKPRSSLPQFITSTTPIIYLKGIASNIKPNDPLLIIDSLGASNFRRAFKVEPDASASRTKVTLTISGEVAPDLVELAAVIDPARIPEEEGPYSVAIADRTTREIQQAAERILRDLQEAKLPVRDLKSEIRVQLPRLEQTYRINNALNLDVIAAWVLQLQQQLTTILQRLESRPEERGPSAVPRDYSQIIQAIRAALLDPPSPPSRRAFAKEIGATEMGRVKVSLAELLRLLENNQAEEEDKVTAVQAASLRLGQLAYAFDELGFTELWEWAEPLSKSLNIDGSGGSPLPPPITPMVVSLTPLILPLLRRPAVPPLNALRLVKPLNQLYAAKADIAPSLLISLQPALGKTLYQARRNITVKPGPAKVYALGTQASLFGHNVPLQITYTDTTPDKPSDWDEWTPSEAEKPNKVFLDGAIDTIAPNHYLVIRIPDTQPQIFQVKEVIIRARTDYGISGKTTEITLNIPEGGTGWWVPTSTHAFKIIRGTVVYAQTTQLDPAEEPIMDDVQGDEIELDDLYQDLKSGRWLVVSGERTDIKDATGAIITGVRASELLMLEHVTEDVRKAPSPSVGVLPGDTLHTTLHLSARLAYTYKRDTVAIFANVVNATHGETLAEVFGSGDGSQGFQRFTLRQTPLTYIAAPTPAGADSTLVVRVNDIEWHEANNFAGLEPKDRKYVIRIEDNGTTSFTFGDGKHGARLPTGIENVKGTYRRGIGAVGNVKAEQISLLAKKPLHVKAVINPLAASGGADRESRDQARRNAPLAVTALDRLISIQDYADFARTFAGIGKASAARLTDNRREIVHLTIAGAGDIPIDETSDLYRNFRRALQLSGDTYQPIIVQQRALSLLVVSARVRLLPDYAWEFVAPKIRSALLDIFSFERRELGQHVTYSEVVSVMQAVEGVAYVDLEVLDAVDEERLKNFFENNGESIAGDDNQTTVVDRFNLVLNSRLSPAMARFDLAGHQFVPAQLSYLDPNLPDTLLLTELST